MEMSFKVTMATLSVSLLLTADASRIGIDTDRNYSRRLSGCHLRPGAESRAVAAPPVHLKDGLGNELHDRAACTVSGAIGEKLGIGVPAAKAAENPG